MKNHIILQVLRLLDRLLRILEVDDEKKSYEEDPQDLMELF